MSDPQEAACELLHRHAQDGVRMTALPPELSPATRRDGYAVQAHIEARSPAPLFGWKIAATSAAGQAHIGSTAPSRGGSWPSA